MSHWIDGFKVMVLSIKGFFSVFIKAAITIMPLPMFIPMILVPCIHDPFFHDPKFHSIVRMRKLILLCIVMGLLYHWVTMS